MGTNHLEDKLTALQERFVEEYQVDFRGREAAVRAGYSPKGANVQAHNLLKLPKIQARITKAREGLQAKQAVNIEYVRTRLVEVVERSMGGLPKDDGNIYPFKPAQALKALELLGRHVGFFAEDNAQKGQVGVPEVEQLPAEVRGILRESLVEYLRSKEVRGDMGTITGPDSGERLIN